MNSTNPRSTVGTSTEIYDYIKLLFARIGNTYSPISGKIVKKHTVTDVTNFVKTFKEETKLLLLCPIVINEDRDLKTVLKVLSQQGYARIKYEDQIYRIDDMPTDKNNYKDLKLVIDRVVVKDDEDFYNRLSDAIQTAFFEGNGVCIIQDVSNNALTEFNNKFELDGILFYEPNTHFFSFNNPYGACSTCEGYGDVVGIDEDLVIPNTGISIYNDAIYPYRTDSYKHYKD